MSATKRWWPMAPVIAWVDARPWVGQKGGGFACDHVGLTGESGREQWVRARRSGRLSDIQAEKIAAHIGIDPVEFWPGWYALALDIHMDASEAELAEWNDFVLAEWTERAEHLYTRLCAMTPAELAAWLGETTAQPAEVAA